MCRYALSLSETAAVPPAATATAAAPMVEARGGARDGVHSSAQADGGGAGELGRELSEDEQLAAAREQRHEHER